MLTGLQKLVGDVVTEVALSSFLDLLLLFRSGRKLRFFCDRKEDDLGFDHYHLSIIGEHERVSYAAMNGVIARWQRPRVLEGRNDRE